MLKTGQMINFIQDAQDPLRSPNTRLICAWLTCGGKLLEGRPFRYTVEKMDDGSEKINVVWLLDAECRVEFPVYTESTEHPGFYQKLTEKVSFKEFSRRFSDEMWNEQNTDHGMSFMYFYKENMKKMIGFLKETSPAIKIRTAKGVAVISKETPEHIKTKILNEI